MAQAEEARRTSNAYLALLLVAVTTFWSARRFRALNEGEAPFTGGR